MKESYASPPEGKTDEAPLGITRTTSIFLAVAALNIGRSRNSRHTEMKYTILSLRESMNAIMSNSLSRNSYVIITSS